MRALRPGLGWLAGWQAELAHHHSNEKAWALAKADTSASSSGAAGAGGAGAAPAAAAAAAAATAAGAARGAAAWHRSAAAARPPAPLGPRAAAWLAAAEGGPAGAAASTPAERLARTAGPAASRSMLRSAVTASSSCFSRSNSSSFCTAAAAGNDGREDQGPALGRRRSGSGGEPSPCGEPLAAQPPAPGPSPSRPAGTAGQRPPPLGCGSRRRRAGCEAPARVAHPAGLPCNYRARSIASCEV